MFRAGVVVFLEEVEGLARRAVERCSPECHESDAVEEFVDRVSGLVD